MTTRSSNKTVEWAKGLSGKDTIKEAREEIEAKVKATEQVIQEYNSANAFVLNYSDGNIMGFALTKPMRNLDDMEKLEQALHLFMSQVLTPMRKTLIQKQLGEAAQERASE
jgi:hypothetical protein